MMGAVLKEFEIFKVEQKGLEKKIREGIRNFKLFHFQLLNFVIK